MDLNRTSGMDVADKFVDFNTECTTPFYERIFNLQERYLNMNLQQQLARRAAATIPAHQHFRLREARQAPAAATEQQHPQQAEQQKQKQGGMQLPFHPAIKLEIKQEHPIPSAPSAEVPTKATAIATAAPSSRLAGSAPVPPGSSNNGTTPATATAAAALPPRPPASLRSVDIFMPKKPMQGRPLVAKPKRAAVLDIATVAELNKEAQAAKDLREQVGVGSRSMNDGCSLRVRQASVCGTLM
jgi:hypothetical protein